MAEKIIMPQLGESIAEGTIVKWLKNPGDKVAKDENILLISTDKVEAEIPSPIDGVLLTTVVGPGETVAVGTVLGTVGKADEAGAAQASPVPAQAQAPAPAPKSAEPVKAAPPPPPPAAPVPAPAAASAPAPVAAAQAQTPTGDRFWSPLVRKIAQDNNIPIAELDRLPGSGREGRVTKNDVLAYIQARPAGAMGSAPAARAATSSAPVARPPVVEIPAGEREVLKPVSSMRKVIMENMINSRRTSAHVTTFFDIDYTAIDRVREAHKDRFKAEEGVALTYTTFLASAVCEVLKRHPYINAEIQGDKIRFKKDVHLGIAVALTEPEPGLMVPVIRGADQMNLRGLAHSITDLAARVRSRKIKLDELSGGSFTITNPGNFGAIIGTPIINQPQVAILGVGQIKKQAVVLEIDGTDVIAIRKMGWLSLSFDHRLIDGATADMFMADLKKTLETWNTAP